MTNRFMMSVAAAALIAGAGFAHAQGTGHEGGAAGGATTQQSAPPSAGTSATTPSHESTEPAKPSSGMKATQSEQKPPMAGKNDRAEETQGQKSKSMSSDNEGAKEGAKGGKDMKAEGRDGKMNSAQSKDGMNSKEGTSKEGMSKEGMSKEGTSTAQTKSGSPENKTTVGQAGAGAKLSTEQRTKITTVIRSQHIAPAEHVNFSISVGTRVPREVSFHPLPAEIVTIYPDWRGYEFFLVGGQIIVVDPATFEIVAVLEA